MNTEALYKQLGANPNAAISVNEFIAAAAEIARNISIDDEPYLSTREAGTFEDVVRDITNTFISENPHLDPNLLTNPNKTITTNVAMQIFDYIHDEITGIVTNERDRKRHEEPSSTTIPQDARLDELEKFIPLIPVIKLSMAKQIAAATQKAP